MSLDGHLNYNMFKVFAISQSRYLKHTCNPQMLNLSMNFTYEIPNLKLNDLRRAIQYYNLLIGYAVKYMNEQDVLYAYSMCQGNWKELNKFLRTIPMAVCSHKHYLERKAVNRAIREKNLEIKKYLLIKAREKGKKIRNKVEKERDRLSKYDYYI